MGGYDTDILMAALRGTAPEFSEDGYVKVVEKKVFGGFITQKMEYWNRFAPDANGSDTVTAAVAEGKKPNEKIDELVKSGVAAVTENADGSRTVAYRGTDRGQYLSRTDLQVCACRVLEQLMDSVSWRESVR